MNVPRPEQWCERPAIDSLERFGERVSNIRAAIARQAYPEAETRAALLRDETEGLEECALLRPREYEVRSAVVDAYRCIGSLNRGEGGNLTDLEDAVKRIVRPYEDGPGREAFWDRDVRTGTDAAHEVEAGLALVDARGALETFWPPASTTEQIHVFLENRQAIKHLSYAQQRTSEWELPWGTDVLFERQLVDLRLATADGALDLWMYPDAHDLLQPLKPETLHGSQKSWCAELRQRVTEQADRARGH